MSPEHGSTPGSRTCGVPKEARVRKRREFLQIQNAGRRVATRHFLVVYACSGDGPPRLGITVTKKIGNAVARNRIKRAVREAFRGEAATLYRGARCNRRASHWRQTAVNARRHGRCARR